LTVRPRQTSVGDSKPFETPVKKKSAWKQLDLSAEKEPPTTAAAAAVQLSPPANPWSRKTAEAAAPTVQRSPSDRINRSFADIMAEDAKVKSFVVQIVTLLVPFHTMFLYRSRGALDSM
jgi:hypothetical protein